MTVMTLPPPSHHSLEDVEDADAVDGDKRGKVRRDVDFLQSAPSRIEGLKGFTFLHVPPLEKKMMKEKEMF